jgi:hypothetical protein
LSRSFEGDLSRKVRCGRCGTTVPAHEIITIERGSISPAEHICNDCNNQSIAGRMGVNYIPLRKKTLTITDNKGVERQFSLTQVIESTGIGIIAKEVAEIAEVTDDKTPGYRFSIHGDFHEKQNDILERLTQKIKKNTSAQYISTRKFAGHSISTVNGFKVAGRLEPIENGDSNSLPVFVVDGKAYTWEELGKILKRFEGFQFKFNFLEMTEDLLP